MSERTNRREQIVDAATKLFVHEGYSATSIRQIADEVGCTEAAIYYHFKDGKNELFQVVVDKLQPDFLGILDKCRHAPTLREFIIRLGAEIKQIICTKSAQFRWVVAEFPKLTDEEKAIFHRKHLSLNQELTRLIGSYGLPESLANQLAWLLLCAGFGYGQLFFNLEMQRVSDFKQEDMVHLFANMADVLVAMRQVMTPSGNAGA